MTSSVVAMIVTLAALFLSVSALVFSAGALRVMRRSSTAKLSHEVAALSEALDSHTLQIRSLKARVGALSKPRKDGKFATPDDAEASDGELPLAGNQRPGETPEQWKRRMNRELALRRIP